MHLYHKLLLEKILGLEKQLDKDMKSLPAELLKSLKKISSKIGLLTGDVDPETGLLKLNEVQKVREKVSFSETIKDNINLEIEYETKIMDALLHTYTINRVAINETVDMIGGITNIPMIDLSEINKIVSSTRLGRTWKERENINKAAFEREVMGEVDNFLSGRTKAKDIQKLIKNKYGLSAYESERLVRTEIATAQTEVNDLYANKQGVKTQFFMATLDSNTSKMCQKLDGTEWDIDDPKKPIPGLGTHPKCRSVLLDQPFPGWKQGTRRDNTQPNKIIPYQNYKDWVNNKDQAGKKYYEKSKDDGVKEIRAESKKLIDKYKLIVPKVTGDLKGIAKTLGGKLKGLEYRLKSEDSLIRKITNDYKEKIYQYLTLVVNCMISFDIH